jgi:hypothetical protein
MHIEFVEIANFRKLLAVRVDLATRTTLFVGANNSGKTSAMLALRRFLTPRRCQFDIHDFTLCHLKALNDIGNTWVQAYQSGVVVDLSVDPWVPALPTLDLWLQVSEAEIHRVRDLVPLMEWTGGRLGVRLRYEPKDLNELFKGFIAAVTQADAMRAAAAVAAAEKGIDAKLPVSTVVNLSQVFGDGTETERFVTRYLRAQHADLFFADAAILVEGPAERMLVPNFIREHYKVLHQSYITLLEIGGSHAHRLRPLIDRLGLLTLIVTDLDSLTSTGGTSIQPALGAGQKTNNATLKTWVPALDDVDALIAATPADKTATDAGDSLFAVRVAYQIPIDVTLPGGTAKETAYPYTFEDALVFENVDFFATLAGPGLNAKFRTAIANGGGVTAVGAGLYAALKDGRKAEFALDVLMADKFSSLKVPRYIAEGLDWLLEQLKKKQVDVLATAPGAAASVATVAASGPGVAP